MSDKVDKELVNLPAAPAFRDDALLLVYVPGSSELAQKLTGAQLREYAEKAAANVKKGDKGDPGDVSSVNGVNPDAKGNVTLTPSQIGAVSKKGDTMAGSLYIEKAASSYFGMKNTARGREGFFELTSDDTVTVYNRKEGDSTNRVALWLGTEAKSVIDLMRINHRVNHASGNTYNVLHTGNKPSGSYTGNGSATSRTIETGGIGSVCLVWSTTGYAALVFRFGALVFRQDDVHAFNQQGATFSDGVLTIMTTDDGLNRSGINYAYQVL